MSILYSASTNYTISAIRWTPYTRIGTTYHKIILLEQSASLRLCSRDFASLRINLIRNLSKQWTYYHVVIRRIKVLKSDKKEKGRKQVGRYYILSSKVFRLRGLRAVLPLRRRRKCFCSENRPTSRSGNVYRMRCIYSWCRTTINNKREKRIACTIISIYTYCSSAADIPRVMKNILQL